MGPLGGQALGEECHRILARRTAEDVDAGHLGVLGDGRAQWQIEHGAQVVLELRRHRPLNGPVPRVVRSGRDLVDQQPAIGRPEQLHGQHDHGIDDLRHPSPQRGGLVTVQLGKGRWTYCAYALYRQLPEAVPGAFRIFVNLINP